MIKQVLGWKTRRKIIVIESDDWGSFRFKSNAIRDKYIPDYNSDYWMDYNDCFESHEDLKQLSKVLESTKDKNNNSACITFLMNPSNPDFKKVEVANFKTFFGKSFKHNLQEREDGEQILAWYQNAIDKHLLEVGFHGREHLNECSWIKDLKNPNSIARNGFYDRIWGQSIISGQKDKISHRSTFEMSSLQELDLLKQNIKDGISILNKTFNQKTTYFLPPDGPYHLSLNKSLVESGIKYIGLAKIHNNPLEPKAHQKKLFWLGKSTKEGLKVITRNVIFEPASPKQADWIGSAMNQIEKAFKFFNPAIISTHRANYTGTLNPKNREDSLNKLKTLLSGVHNKWPGVEFMTSSQLGNIMSKSD